MTDSIQRLVGSLRRFRALHRWMGIPLGVFMIIMALTGLILGWKKNVDVLQPPTGAGQSTDMRAWLGLDKIANAATRAMDVAGIDAGGIDRMDVRPGDGVVKVQFKDGYWEVQVDATTGEVLSRSRRHADWIEKVHDGSIITDMFKLAYTNLTGIGLSVLALSGLWLWLGPKALRRLKTLQKME